jgi:WD40 repeat protein
VAYSADGATLAAAGEDRTITLFDAAAGTEKAKLAGHKNWISSLAFQPGGGTLLASGGFDRAVKLWDLATGAEAATLEGYKGTVWAVAFSPDGTLLATGSASDSIKLWDVASRTEKFPDPAPATTEAATPAE